MKANLNRFLYISVFFFSFSLYALCNQVLLEFKAAAFIPTHKLVRSLYGNVSALGGPEVTFQFSEDSNWYGFASLDVLRKKGKSIGLCDPTRMRAIPVAVGIKYFVPCYSADFYIGAGVQAMHLKTINNSPFVVHKTAKWGGGALVKIGSYIYLPCNFFIDLFFDYSISRIGCDKRITCAIPLRAKLDGAIFGLGVGYSFD
jgi:hypothetical protein